MNASIASAATETVVLRGGRASTEDANGLQLDRRQTTCREQDIAIVWYSIYDYGTTRMKRRKKAPAMSRGLALRFGRPKRWSVTSGRGGRSRAQIGAGAELVEPGQTRQEPCPPERAWCQPEPSGSWWYRPAPSAWWSYQPEPGVVTVGVLLISTSSSRLRVRREHEIGNGEKRQRHDDADEPARRVALAGVDGAVGAVIGIDGIAIWVSHGDLLCLSTVWLKNASP